MLAQVQRRSGFVTPILYDTQQPIPYIEGRYVINLRERMEKIRKMKLWIKGAWAPRFQRVNNKSIMERIVRLKGMTKDELKQVKVVRLWMRVVTMADMTNKAGTDIIDNMICGQWRAGTDLKWPKEHCPRKKCWSTFRSCMRQVFSTQTPSNK